MLTQEQEAEVQPESATPSHTDSVESGAQTANPTSFDDEAKQGSSAGQAPVTLAAEEAVSYLTVVDATTLEALFDHLRAPCRNATEFVLRAAAYLTSAFSARPSDHQDESQNNRTVDGILTSGWASCGDRAHLMELLMAKAGLRTRRVGFASVPYQNNHSAIEVFSDGDWRFVDPTVGYYFSAPGDVLPLPMAKARRLFPKVSSWRTIGAPMAGPQQGSVPVSWRMAPMTPLYDLELGRPYFFAKETYFDGALHGGDDVAYDDYELTLKLDASSEILLGRPGVPGALAQAVNLGQGPILPTQFDRLGLYDQGNIRHILNLISDVPLRIRVTVGLCAGHDASSIAFAVRPAITPELFDPPFFDARITKAYDVGGGNLAAVDLYVLPPMTKVVVSMPWSGEGYVEFYWIQALEADLQRT